jgi:hypothetical protein
VLSVLPSTLRLRVLEELYAADVRRCYLFRGTTQKLLDAMLSAGNVQLFMPKVDRCCQSDGQTDRRPGRQTDRQTGG